MDYRTLVLTLAVAVGLTSCAGRSVEIRPTTGALQEVKFEGGDALVHLIGSNRLTGIVVPRRNVIAESARIPLFVYIKNLYEEPIVFSPENVSARIIPNGAALTVMSSEALQAEAEAAIAQQRAAAALSIIGNTMTAIGGGYQQRTGQSNTTGPAGATIRTYNDTVYDPNRALEAQRRANELNESAIAASNRNQESIRNSLEGILHKQTIAPGTDHSGVIEIEAPRSKNEPVDIEVSLVVGRETHRAFFTYAPIAN